MDRILANNPGHRLARATPADHNRTTASWAADIEKLHRIDRVPYAAIESTLEWSQDDQFWRANILSGGKLREQYDKLTAQRARGGSGRTEPRRPEAFTEVEVTL